MRASRRMGRMKRNKPKHIPMSLTSLMDVFTNLVFFLLLSQGVVTVQEPPKEIKLPDSFVETVGHPSVNITVSNEIVSIQGEQVAATADLLTSQSDLIPAVRDKLALIKGTSIGTSAETKDGTEVTILANETIPFKVMKKLMMTCTSAGYNKISLAVRQNSGVTAPPPK